LILHGPRLLVSPHRTWSTIVGRDRQAISLIAAAITAAVWPASAVVAGHIGSAALAYEESTIAILRAMVGFMAVVGGSLVMAPALTLALLWTSETSRGTVDSKRAGAVAMGLLWPTWTAGIILVVPPLLDLGPELGEFLWLGLATLVVIRLLNQYACPTLTVRRRWKSRFVLRSTIVYLLLFTITAIAPAMFVRSMLGASSPHVASLPTRPALPLPPEPNW
jgi:hypothetical protein